MSGTGSLMIRNLRKPADYRKAVMTQDQLLKIAVANDSNISNARRSAFMGEIPPLTQGQQQTADELQQDTGKNESDALNNLLSLGFRYDEASQIVNDMTFDERVVMNNTFPSVKTDFLKKFDVKRTTATAFIEYIRRYVEIFRQTKGIDAPNALFNDKFDAIINNLDDIRAIIPPPAIILEIRKNVKGLPAELQVQLAELQDNLPSEAFFRQIANDDEILQYEQLAMLQDLLEDLPTREQFQRTLDEIKSGQLTQEEKIDAIENLVGALDTTTFEGLAELKKTVASQKGSVSSANIVSSIDVPTDNIQGLGYGTLATSSGASTGKAQLFLLDANGQALTPFPSSEFNRAYSSDEQFRSWVLSQFGGRKPTYKQLETLVKGGGSATSSAVSDITGVSTGQSGITSMESTSTATQQGKGIKTKKIGKGVMVEEQPAYRHFGKYVLHANQLLNNDVLNVKYPSLGRIPQFRPTTISEPTKEFIMDLLDSGKANQRVYDTLPMEDRKIFEKIATGAGIFSHLKLKKTTSNEEQKDYERFQVLRGEYYAGNNSQALMKELRKLIVKFMSEGRIHRSEGTNLLMELSI